MGEKSKRVNIMGEVKLKTNHIKGILCILAAALGFSFMTFFVRISGDVPTMQKAFFRNAVAAVVSVGILLRTPEKFKIKRERIM